MLCNALSRYTSSPPAGGAVSLRLGQAWLLTSPGGQFTTKPLLRSPQRGSQGQFAARRLIIRTPTCPRCAACTDPSTLIPHAVVVSPPYSGGQVGTPLAALSFLSFSFSEKEKRIGFDAVGKSLSENLIRQPPPIRHYPLQTSSALCQAATRRQSLRRCRRAL